MYGCTLSLGQALCMLWACLRLINPSNVVLKRLYGRLNALLSLCVIVLLRKRRQLFMLISKNYATNIVVKNHHREIWVTLHFLNQRT